MDTLCTGRRRVEPGEPVFVIAEIEIDGVKKVCDSESSLRDKLRRAYRAAKSRHLPGVGLIARVLVAATLKA